MTQGRYVAGIKSAILTSAIYSMTKIAEIGHNCNLN